MPRAWRQGNHCGQCAQRSYPLGTVASQVLATFARIARRTANAGSTASSRSNGAALGGGADIDLTIDPNIQIEAEKIMDDTVAQHGVTGGSVIVEDPQTGKILAMGATPDFDPNYYSSSSIANFLNPTIESVYQPDRSSKCSRCRLALMPGKSRHRRPTMIWVT